MLLATTLWVRSHPRRLVALGDEIQEKDVPCTVSALPDVGARFDRERNPEIGQYAYVSSPSFADVIDQVYVGLSDEERSQLARRNQAYFADHDVIRDAAPLDEHLHDTLVLNLVAICMGGDETLEVRQALGSMLSYVEDDGYSPLTDVEYGWPNRLLWSVYQFDYFVGQSSLFDQSRSAFYGEAAFVLWMNMRIEDGAWYADEGELLRLIMAIDRLRLYRESALVAED